MCKGAVEVANFGAAVDGLFLFFVSIFLFVLCMVNKILLKIGFFIWDRRRGW